MTSHRQLALRRADGALTTVASVVVLGLAALGALAATVDPFTFGFYLAYAVVGVYLATRRPSNAVSWLLVAIAFSFIGTTSVPSLDRAALIAGTAPLRDEILAWVGAWSTYATFLGFAALAILYPSGSLPAGRWRRVAQAGLIVGLLAAVAPAIAPTIGIPADSEGLTHVQVANPFGLLPPDVAYLPISDVAILIVLVLVALAVASLVVRFRRSRDVLRLQLRWLLAALVAVVLAITVGLMGSLFEPATGGLEWLPAIVAYPFVPAAVAVAVLRYRLYEIDRLVNRTVVYGAVTAILAGIFAAAIAVTQRVFIALTGESSEAAVVLVTLVVAALFVPVRKRTEAFVDRYLKYEERRFGAYRSDLAGFLALVDPARAAQRLAAETVRETGVAAAAVVGEDGQIVATAGVWPADIVIEVPIGQSEGPLRSIRLARRPDGREIPESALAALNDVAQLAAAAIPRGAGLSAARSSTVPLEAASAQETATSPMALRRRGGIQQVR